MKILIIGRHEVLYDSAVLLSKEHQIVGVITAPAPSEYSKKENDFRQLAKKLHCPFLLVKKKKENIANFIDKVKPDIGVSVNWIYIVGEEIISRIPKGILNLHSGDLPSYKGNAVSNWALISGEKKILMTVHFMKPNELDAGDIILKKPVSINQNTTIGEIVLYWNKLGPKMFQESIKRINSSSFKPIPQKGKGFRCFPRIPMDGKIDWSKSAREIHNLIRATTHPYTGAYTFLKINGFLKKVYIWKSFVVKDHTIDLGTPGQFILNNKDTGQTHIYCGKGIIAILEVQYEGGKVFYPGKIWNSIRLRFGFDIEEELINLTRQLTKKA